MERLIEHHHRLRIDHCLDAFNALVKEKRAFLDNTAGNFLRFKKVLESIPDFAPSMINLDEKSVTIGTTLSLAKRPIYAFWHRGGL